MSSHLTGRVLQILVLAQAQAQRTSVDLIWLSDLHIKAPDRLQICAIKVRHRNPRSKLKIGCPTGNLLCWDLGRHHCRCFFIWITDTNASRSAVANSCWFISMVIDSYTMHEWVFAASVISVWFFQRRQHHTSTSYRIVRFCTCMFLFSFFGSYIYIFLI